MRNPLSKTIVTIQPSGIRKFFDIVNEMEDAISLGVGEPDFDTPWHIRDEGIYSLEKGRTFYTSNAGLKELKIEIAKYLFRNYDLQYDYQHEIVVTVGGSEAIDIAMRAMLDPGDEVLIPMPSYVSYLPCAVLANGVPVPINLKAENDFRLTAEELEAAITPKTKLLVMPFPNNPTGAIMEKKDLEAVAEVVKKHDLFVISDEIYSALTYTEKHISIASLPGMKERTIVINGFSKSHAMTGWRLGYACGPRIILDQMLKIHQYAIMCAPTTSQYAAVDALRAGDEDVQRMREEYNGRRRYLMHRFEEMGLECFEPYGAFYCFPCIKEFGMTSEEFATRFLQEKKVLLGVANIWEKRKGLDVFLQLASRLPEEYQIVLVGVSDRQSKKLPEKILGIPRTGKPSELAQWYTLADIYVNPTYEDNFPTTNLEALSCGTPVITFATGGSPEAIDASCGKVVPKGDVDALLAAILAGVLTGLCTGWLHTKLGIPAILAGILTQFSLYSINLRRAVHSQVGDVEHAERDVDPERHQGPQKSLRNGRDDEIDHIYFTQVTFLATSSGTVSPNSFTMGSFKTTLNSV